MPPEKTTPSIDQAVFILREAFIAVSNDLSKQDFIAVKAQACLQHAKCHITGLPVPADHKNAIPEEILDYSATWPLAEGDPDAA